MPQTELLADIDRQLDDNHKRYLAARASAFRRYDAEKRDYAGKWAERTEMRRGAWRQFREMWEPLERTRRLRESQKENLQKLEARFQGEREARLNQPHSRDRGRDDEFER